MESLVRNQNNDYDDFFYATMCHVCKRFGDDVSLKLCSKCKMISYCSQVHQRQHWKQHKPLCKAIQDALQKYDFNRGGNSEGCVERKLIFMTLVSLNLGRRLNDSELEMLCLPKECLVCHERNFTLESCQKCANSFCNNHKDGTEHTNICGHLELRLRTNLLALKDDNDLLDLHLHLHYFLQNRLHISYKSSFQNMKDFLEDIGVVQTVLKSFEVPHDILSAECSQYLTHPLTLFYAMRLLNDVPKSKDLVIHVIGATVKKEHSLIGWEVLPRITMVSVLVVFVGPKLSCALNPSHDCDNCSREKKCLTFEFHNVLYEKYARSSSFRKPDLVVGFNLCIHQPKLKGSSSNIWAPCIKLIAKQNFPFVLTSSTLYAFKKETHVINTILDKQVDHLYSGKNPFGGLIASRTVGVDYISFMNQYVTVYRSLCS